MKKLKPQNAYLSLALLLTVFVAGCSSGGSSSDSTPVPTDTTVTGAPTVTHTAPADATVDVAINSKITATFSEEMTGATLTETTFTVTAASGAAVAGAVTYADAVNTAIFTPTADLAASTDYTAKITTGAKDLAGNPLAVDKTWSFTTGTTADTTPPTVFTTVPALCRRGVHHSERLRNLQ